MLACACGGRLSGDGGDGGVDAFGPPIPLPVPRNTTPDATSAQVEAFGSGVSTFGLAVLADLATHQPNDNLVVSPYCIASALAMTYVGAGGTTASQMASVLDFPSSDPTSVADAFDAIDLSLASRASVPSSGFVTHVANGIWGQQGYGWQPSFIDTLAAEFGAALVPVDFPTNAPAITTSINAWVSANTDGIIPTLLPDGSITPSTLIVLVDALALHASWGVTFDAPANETFTRADGTTTTTPSISTTTAEIAYATTATYDAVSIPFSDPGGGGAMIVIMPTQGQWATFVPTFTNLPLTFSNVALTLPTFSIQTGSMSIASTLKALGMTAAFDPTMANFEGMTSSSLYIADVLHEADITVDQNGVTAAAATGVIGGAEDVPPKPVPIVVNRPFYFAIVDKQSNSTLFVGRFLHP